MPLIVGNTQIKDIYLGDSKIKEAYLGRTKIYGKSPVFKDRYEFTLFESTNGVSSGNVADAFRNYDMIGIRLSHNLNQCCANWVWFPEHTFTKDSGNRNMLYSYYDGNYFRNLLCYIYYDNLNKSFSVIVPSSSIGWELYTKADDSSQMYGADGVTSIISKIVGVKFQ